MDTIREAEEAKTEKGTTETPSVPTGEMETIHLNDVKRSGCHFDPLAGWVAN